MLYLNAFFEKTQKKEFFLYTILGVFGANSPVVCVPIYSASARAAWPEFDSRLKRSRSHDSNHSHDLLSDLHCPIKKQKAP